ncbi:MAG: chromosome segregation protein SMC [Gammaproteobacteria bacterium]
MRLTAFKAQGFKSFPDAASFKVGEPLIGVVGPNGCGKSNIVDAVRWVLGESRLSALRSRALPDVLFNGSQSRPPADWCGVDLTFANDGNRDLGAWSSYSEIVVRRELGRDGQSFFYINGAPVRRRDVVALFRGTGLSARAYGVVEQGTIGRVAEASPDELRGFVEEAAGVSHYKENRRETERRLSASEENLQQLRRIAEEVEKQTARLKRQAQQARRYENLQVRIAELESLILWQKRITAGEDLAKARAALTEQTAQAKKIADDFESLKVQAQKARAERDNALSAAAAAREELGKLQLAAAAAKQNMQNAEQIRRTAAERIGEDRGELATLQKRIADGEQQQKQHKAQLGQIRRDIQSAQVETEEKTKQAEQAAKQLAGYESAAMRARAALTAAGGRIKSDEARAQMTAEETARIVHQLRAAKQSLEETIATAQSEAPPTEDATANADKCRQDLAEAEDALRAALANTEQAQQAQQQAEKHLLAAQTEKDALETVAAAAAGEWAQDPPPRLADVLRVEAGEWAMALDAALGYAAGAFAVDNVADFVGRRGLPPPGSAVVAVADAPLTAAEMPPHPQMQAPPLLSKVNAPPESIKVLAASLGGVYAAEDESDALAMAAHLSPGEKLITRAGVVYESRSVYARGETLGGYDWRRRMEQLASAVQERKSEADTAAEKTGQCRKQNDTAQSARDNAAAELEKAKNTLAEKRVETSQWQERRANAQKRQTELGEEIAALTARKTACEQTAAELANAHTDAARREQQSRDDADKCEAELKTAAAAVEESREMARAAAAKHKELNARAAELMRRQKEEENTAGEAQNRAKLLAARLQQTENETQQSDDNALRMILQKSTDEAKDAEARAAKAEQTAACCAKAADDAETRREQCYGAMQGKQNDIGELRLNERELSLAMGRMNDSLEAAAVGDERLKELAAEQPNAGEEINTLRQRRDAIGGVNFAAADELQEAQSRAETLAAQTADIAGAVDELRAAIRRIDEETARRMTKMHADINGEFDALFKQFFGGGDAQLAQVADTDGFEIRARPPGKRLFSSRALSGGEKAAAALAFVFALLKLNPPPFCILDEVDAALDERRSDNFVALLKDLSANFQFLVITHNPLTLEQMGRLVGVTQEEKGVSKIVTVNLQQALAAVR